MARKALGRGFKGLISSPAESTPHSTSAQPPSGDGLADLDVMSISPSPYQPRRFFDEEKLEELAQSIKEQGLIEPVVVRKRKDGGHELIVGERRWRAYQSLGMKTIPCRIMDVADDRMRELGLIENLQRDDLNPMEIAVAMDMLRQEHGFTHEVISKRLGISRAKVSNTLRLLDLPEEVKTLVSEGQLSEGHARAILALPDALSQIQCARKVVKGGMSVRDVEAMILPKQPKKKGREGSGKSRDTHLADLENRLRSHFGTQVHIQDEKGKGRIVIEYYSTEDATRIVQCMGLGDDLD